MSDRQEKTSYSSYMDTEALDLINFSLEEKIKELEEMYNNMNNKIKVLDGTNDTWKGKAQEAFYDYYTRVSSHFPDVVDQLRAYSVFLAQTVEEYHEREQSIQDDEEKNTNNLDINN